MVVFLKDTAGADVRNEQRKEVREDEESRDSRDLGETS